MSTWLQNQRPGKAEEEEEEHVHYAWWYLLSSVTTIPRICLDEAVATQLATLTSAIDKLAVECIVISCIDIALKLFK